MAVRRFRSVEEATAYAAEQTAGEGLQAALELSAFCWQLRPWRTPRGVFRNRSVAEARERRLRWERAVWRVPSWVAAEFAADDSGAGDEAGELAGT